MSPSHHPDAQFSVVERQPQPLTPNPQLLSPIAGSFETDIPARLDRLPWSAFHSLVVVAMGITWILDGLEVTLAGAVGSALRDSPTMHMDAAKVGAAASTYLLGVV